MAQPNSFRVFLSAVSNELASYRADVARVLRRKGIEVRDQEHFRLGGATLVEALRDYIRECDAVVLLVGDQCGSLAGQEHAAELGQNAWFDRFTAATGCSQASYTQWEFLLAKQFGKKTYLFMTADGFRADKPIAESPDAAANLACQAKYRDWLDETGVHWSPLTTAAKLLEDVLVLNFPDVRQPRPNNLPYRSLGTLFKGREQFLTEMHAKLTASAHGAAAITTRPKAVYGAGGIGKTRAAIEYAWRHEADYTALLFLSADSPAALETSLAGLVGVLNIEGMDEAPDNVRLRAVLDWLRANPGWLAILDNADTADAAAAAKARLSDLSHGRVLITSRISDWSGSVERLDLELLAVDDAADYLLEAARDRLRADDDAEQAKAVGEKVGLLALGLEHAAAYVNVRQMSFAEYLRQWDDDEEAILQEFDLPQIDYPHALLVTWRLSADRLDGDARKLLETFSWFAAEPIPDSIFAALPEGVLETDWRKAITTLSRYSLITRGQSGEQRTLQLHRLVQATTRYHLRHAATPADGQRLPSLESALGWIDAAFQGDGQDVRDWPQLDPLVEHVLSICHFAEAEHKTTAHHATARLLNQAGVLFYTKARYQVAEPLNRRALAIDEQSYGAEHPNVAIRLNNLAELLRVTNRPAEAEPLVRRALAIDEQSLGAEHPNVAIRLNNLATLLQDTNRLAEAEPLMRRALAIDEQSYGPEHPEVAYELNNLAQLLQATNRLAEAEPMMRRALAIGEQSLGAEHAWVANPLNNLAMLLQATNRLAEAEPLMRRAVEIFRASLGDEHPNTVTVAENYRQLREELGEA